MQAVPLFANPYSAAYHKAHLPQASRCGWVLADRYPLTRIIGLKKTVLPEDQKSRFHRYCCWMTSGSKHREPIRR